MIQVSGIFTGQKSSSSKAFSTKTGKFVFKLHLNITLENLALERGGLVIC